MASATRPYVFRAGLLRATLAERRITQEDLARRIGVRLGTVGRWCRERAEPRGHELIALSDQLGIPAAEFYEEREAA